MLNYYLTIFSQFKVNKRVRSSLGCIISVIHGSCVWDKFGPKQTACQCHSVTGILSEPGREGAFSGVGILHRADVRRGLPTLSDHSAARDMNSKPLQGALLSSAESIKVADCTLFWRQNPLDEDTERSSTLAAGRCCGAGGSPPLIPDKHCSGPVPRLREN